MTASPDTTLAAALGSRICHDLISPLGAICNGIELLGMADRAGAPEIDLIRESVETANARIRFFRIAYGTAPDGQQIAAQEVKRVIGDYARYARVSIEWPDMPNPGRPAARLAFLLIQCLEAAMPFGGQITVTRPDGGWRLRGASERMKHDEALWAGLSGGDPAPAGAPPRPDAIQFLLARPAAEACGVSLAVGLGENRIDIGF